MFKIWRKLDNLAKICEIKIRIKFKMNVSYWHLNDSKWLSFHLFYFSHSLSAVILVILLIFLSWGLSDQYFPRFGSPQFLSDRFELALNRVQVDNLFYRVSHQRWAHLHRFKLRWDLIFSFQNFWFLGAYSPSLFVLLSFEEQSDRQII